MRNITISAIALLALLGTTGCETQLPDTEAPEFVGGNDYAAFDQEGNYPSGAVGYGVGDLVPNYEFVGYAEFTNTANVGLQVVKLSDFYNPTGVEVFPEGSPYGAGQPKPVVLNLVSSSVWCPPCNYEAEQILNPKQAQYKPSGGHILAVLIDGPSRGVPATLQHLTNWSTKYQTPYTMVVDPSSQVMDVLPAAFPSNMIIDTRTMEIVEIVSGIPDDAFWAKFEALLNN